MPAINNGHALSWPDPVSEPSAPVDRSGLAIGSAAVVAPLSYTATAIGYTPQYTGSRLTVFFKEIFAAFKKLCRI